MDIYQVRRGTALDFTVALIDSRGDPIVTYSGAEALSATDALALATSEAARALRIEDRVGTLSAGKRADLAVVSLAGSPYHPVEDPAAAVVFGGSPERVLETIVDGQTRYASEKEEQWREVRSTASAARHRMLAPQP